MGWSDEARTANRTLTIHVVIGWAYRVLVGLDSTSDWGCLEGLVVDLVDSECILGMVIGQRRFGLPILDRGSVHTNHHHFIFTPVIHRV